MSSRPVHVVIVAYGPPDDLDRCLAALDGTLDVTIVDNSSSAAVAAVADRRVADYVDAGRNLGFAAAVNLALDRLGDEEPRDVLLLNPDATLQPAQIARLHEHLHGRPRLAAVSPRLAGTDGAEHRVEWPFPSPGRAWLEAFGLGKLPARSSFVIGAALLLRWEALQEVGRFDDRFFLYAEETDWQRRARARGWRSEVCRDVIASHVGAGASSDAPRRELLFHSAHELYLRKWHGRLGWLAYRSAVVVGAALRAALLRSERRREAARRAVLYLRGPVRAAAAGRK
jgi:GT2 family glycosyltransferase